MREPFLDARRLLRGPWQAFERDVARLLVCNGFADVRVVGGAGDRGADVLGVKKGQLWVIQCKYTSRSYPPPTAVDEVGEAARFYGADRVFVASSRPTGPGTQAAIQRWRALGIEIETLQPRALLDIAARSPEYPPSRRTLRDYQEEAVADFIAALRETGRGQVVLATGLGKTVVLAEALAQLFRDEAVPYGRALVLASTRELVDQLHRAFWDQIPKWIATHRLIGGETPSHWDGITFATVQSVGLRIDELPDFGVVFIDEAHHIGSETFRRVTDRLSDAMIGGVTATPWRGDRYDIDSLLGPPVTRIGIAEGLPAGFSVRGRLPPARRQHRLGVGKDALAQQLFTLPTEQTPTTADSRRGGSQIHSRNVRQGRTSRYDRILLVHRTCEELCRYVAPFRFSGAVDD